MKKLSMSSLFSAAMLTAGSAFAGGGALLGGSGGGMEVGTMYGGASVGQATTDCMMKDENECSSSGFKVYGGYKVADMLAVEGGYYNLGTMEESVKGSTTQGQYTIKDPVAEGEANGFGVAAIASVPVVDNLEVFGKAGAMFWKSEATVKATITDTSSGQSAVATDIAEKDGTSLLLGVGASYKLNDNWGVRGEYEHFKRQDLNDEDHNVGIMSVGATFSTL
ncbi:MAG: hypothetical protein E6Q85_03885 [Thiothrix sp.]|nr:MAG: hypothetical protein E6Q85_03885 [Thiothrix sp.]